MRTHSGCRREESAVEGEHPRKMRAVHDPGRDAQGGARIEQEEEGRSRGQWRRRRVSARDHLLEAGCSWGRFIGHKWLDSFVHAEREAVPHQVLTMPCRICICRKDDDDDKEKQALRGGLEGTHVQRCAWSASCLSQFC